MSDTPTASGGRALAVLIFGAAVIGFVPILVRLSDTGSAAAGFWRLAFALPGVVSILIGISFIFGVRSGRITLPEATAREKAHVGFAPGWLRALASLAMVTAAGGFVFGAMTFIIPRLFEVGMPNVTTDVALTGVLAAAVYAIAAFAQLVVGRIIDKHRVKPVLVAVALGQPVLIGVMAMQSDYGLFFAALLAMGFVFGQIPITDAVLSRYVPDQWRAKVLSVKFMLNLVIGAGALFTARAILAAGYGFDTFLLVLATAAALIVLAALVLPARSGQEIAAEPRAVPA